MQQHPAAQIRFETSDALRAEPASYAHARSLAHGLRAIRYCKVETFQDCALGTIHIPGKGEETAPLSFGFYEADGILTLFEDSGRLQDFLDAFPNLFDDPHPNQPLLLVLQALIEDDIFFLTQFETELETLEDALLHHLPKDFFLRLTEYRQKLSELNAYYEQLTNLGEQMHAGQAANRDSAEAWGNFSRRTELLQNHVRLLRENVVQLRELYHARQDARQNQVTMLLTVVTTLCLPLNLLSGWYGMNFRYMPELQWKYGYWCVIALAAGIIALEIVYFKKKKFL